MWRNIFLGLLFVLGLSAKAQYFLVKPPQTDSLAIFKVGVEGPFQIKTSIGYNFSPKVRVGIGYGWVRPQMFSQGFSMMTSLEEGTTGRQTFDSIEWKANSFSIHMAYSQTNYYLRFGMESLSFNRGRLLLEPMPSTAEHFSLAYPNDTLTSTGALPLLSSQTYLNLSIGTSLLNIGKKMYLVGEIGVKPLIRSKFYFLTNTTQLANLSEAKQEYFRALESDLKAIFNTVRFRPTVNLYLVYKLKTCDCENY